MMRIAPIAVLCGLLVGGGASWAAQPCLDATGALAKTYGLSIDPPGGRPGDPPIPAELGRSGGVVEPPPTRDPAVMKPQPGQRSAMPTMPDITPSNPPAGTAGSPALRPSDRAALQSILVAARDHARKGEEDACVRQLRKATDFLGEIRKDT